MKVILVYSKAHHAKSSPGNEILLHGMTMHHLLVGGKFSGFPLLEKRLCLAASTEVVLVTPYSLTDELLNRGENVFCHNSNTNIYKQAGNFQKQLD